MLDLFGNHPRNLRKLEQGIEFVVQLDFGLSYSAATPVYNCLR